MGRTRYFGVDSIPLIMQVAAILDFCCDVLHIVYFHKHSLDRASAVDIGEGMCSAECL